MTTPASTTTGPPSTSKTRDSTLNPPFPNWGLSVLSLVLLLGSAFGQSSPPTDDPRQIILRSIQRDERDVDIARNYTYLVRTETRFIDSSGKVKPGSDETHEALVLYGAPYRRLVAKHGKPLSPEEDRKEQEKMDQEVAKRRKESENDKQKLAREETKRIEDQKEVIREVSDAYNFQMLPDEDVDGHPTWVIQGEPRPGYKPRSRQADILHKLHGKLWVAKDDYRWVKMQAEVTRTFSFGLLLMRMEPGTLIEFEQKRVQDEIWMPRTERFRGVGRFMLKKFRMEIVRTYTDYKKFQSDSRIMETSEIPATPPQ